MSLGTTASQTVGPYLHIGLTWLVTSNLVGPGVTGEPITLGRLEARPIATMTVEAQARHERRERISRDA